MAQLYIYIYSSLRFFSLTGYYRILSIVSYAIQQVLVGYLFYISSVISSVAQPCLTLCNPMDCSMPGLPVHHQLLEFAQTHVHLVSDAIQPSHPLLTPSLLVLSISQSLHRLMSISR